MTTPGLQEPQTPAFPTAGANDPWRGVLTPAQTCAVLLAIADDDLIDPAIGVANTLARERGAMPTVIQAFDPAPYGPPPFTLAMISFAETLIGPTALAERRQAIETRLERVCGHPISWPIVLRLGNPITCIIDEAHERHSELLVLGLHHHRWTDRLIGAETTIQVMTNAGIPVLAVTKDLSGLPNHLLIAVDFGRTSVYMAMLAARLVAPNGRITLAYVQYPEASGVEEDAEGFEVIHHEGVAAAFAKLVTTIAVPPPVTVETVILEGDPAIALRTYAEQSNPNLIAVASQRHPFVAKLLLGSVSRTLVRDGRWSVFVTPPARPQRSP